MKGRLMGSSVLIVDDDPSDRRILERALLEQDADLAIDTVDNGAAALAHLQQGARPGLIVTDLNMPEMGGKQLLEWLQDVPALRQVAKVVMSSSDDADDQAACMARNADAYIVKPDALAGYRDVAARLVRMMDRAPVQVA